MLCTKPIHSAQSEVANKASPARRTAHSPEPRFDALRRGATLAWHWQANGCHYGGPARYAQCALLNQHVYLLGGNQLEQVREHFYPLASVLGYRWPP